MSSPSIKIVFFGTPDFAVPSLRILLENGYNVVSVVTAPDKPSGRGMNLSESAVKQFAAKNKLMILQPENLKDEKFLAQLKSLNADLFIVVAFRMLPDSVWMMPSKGSFNLHASLLPQYRGAAPINRVLINGEKETGVTSFFLQKEIDTGKIIFQEKVCIEDQETAGELHDKLMNLGASLVLKTTMAIEKADVHGIEQSVFFHSENELKKAPKIFKENCRVEWEKKSVEIFNLIRGLSPYPAAFTEFFSVEGEPQTFKIFRAESELFSHSFNPGQICTDEKSYLKIATSDGYISITEIQQAGKKKMKIEEFLRGFRISNYHRAGGV